jgi:hypothetical protein
MPVEINVKNTALEVCSVSAAKRHTRKYVRARQYVSRQRKLEREAAEQGLVLSNLCACHCGLTIKPSLKRPFFRGHSKLATGVLRSRFLLGVLHG